MNWLTLMNKTVHGLVDVDSSKLVISKHVGIKAINKSAPLQEYSDK